MWVLICIGVFIILYVLIGIVQPMRQIKKASFGEKRKWVKKLREMDDDY